MQGPDPPDVQREQADAATESGQDAYTPAGRARHEGRQEGRLAGCLEQAEPLPDLGQVARWALVLSAASSFLGTKLLVLGSRAYS